MTCTRSRRPTRRSWPGRRATRAAGGAAGPLQVAGCARACLPAAPAVSTAGRGGGGVGVISAA